MIGVREDGRERELTYEEFVEEIRSGRIRPDTLVRSDVLTSGAWKPAAELQFFRSWAPEGTVPRRLPAREPEPPPVEAPGPETSYEPPLRQADGLPAGGIPAGGTPGAPEEPPPGRARIPWEEQDRVGFFRALYDTIHLAFDDGAEYTRRIAGGYMVMPALVFGLIITGVSSLIYGAYMAGMFHLMKGTFEQMRSMLPEGSADTGPPGIREIVFLVGMSILFYPAAAMIWAGIVHLLLRIFRKAQGPFSATFRVTAYAIAPMVLNILPLCGAVIGAIWALVLTVRGLATVHRSGTFAPAMAVLIPVIIWLVLSVIANQQLLASLSRGGGS